MRLLADILLATLDTLLEAAPYLLLGLLMAGLVHVLMPQRLIQRWMGKPGMGGVVRAALIGVPLPVCSCGVVPITVELRRKGASQPAALSFLTTTPESSVDSIVFTWGLMGPLFAVARPIAAFLTAIVGGLGAMLFLKEGEIPAEAPAAEPCGECAPSAGFDPPAGAPARRRLWRDVLRPAIEYGFVELLDDLAFWLVLGILIAGLLTGLLPSDLADRGLGAGIVPMLLLLVVGIPLYMCASASTPIAAALLAKGVGPGAALVFLLAGPATNAATVVLLSKTFGGRFVRVYLGSVILTALACGIAFEILVGPAAALAAPLAEGLESGPDLLHILCAALLTVLLAWRLSRGAFADGLRELRNAFG
ncbi:MAG: SO_0444 family Cu/Zn efflux transporter [Thermoanaerobaculia bacterium]|nr:SO_0444 family Cu/Zn efflux transporter [Thermoanaerobaculia bacterium]